MINFKFALPSLELSLRESSVRSFQGFFERHALTLIIALLIIISTASFLIFYQNGLGLAYNDARSHLDIARRVVESLKPGLAQLGSVWLPLTHALMIPTIWNDFMWHSGLSGALQSMIAYVATGLLVYKFLEKLNTEILVRIIGVAIFALNLNILYLQSTAMTELVLIATMTAGTYYLLTWAQDKKLTSLIACGFFIFLSTLVRYDGWFLLAIAAVIIGVLSWQNFGKKSTEGLIIFFLTLASFGIILWFLWNLLIFKDPLYFSFGPYSARAQQLRLEQAGVLATKGDLLFSAKIYLYSVIYNLNAFTFILSIFGMVALWLEKSIKKSVRIAAVILLTVPFFFNVLALYLGHSVLFIQGLSGNTWFNVRYGVMMLPAAAVFVGYLVHKIKPLRVVIIGLLLFVTFFSLANVDAVTIDDARVGSSQKNVSEVSGWLNQNTKDKKGFILIAAASHDAIIFSSGLPMKKFIHEGTGAYWGSATTSPDRWARWIVMRTNDLNDSTFKFVKESGQLEKYDLIDSYPFADIYQIKAEYLESLNTEPILGKQK